jgi:hypothetical protein
MGGDARKRTEKTKKPQKRMASFTHYHFTIEAPSSAIDPEATKVSKQSYLTFALVLSLIVGFFSLQFATRKYL